MKQPVFTGSSVAIITPFTDSGAVNYEELGNLIEFQIENHTDSITICGTTGEGSTLSDAEHREAMRYCIDVVAGRVPVIAGTGSNDTAYALELSQFACEAGADALLMVTPYYNKTSQRGLVHHYEYLADRVSKPIIIYNVPSRTGMSIQAETYYELSKHPNINGVKEASGDFTLIAHTRHLCGDELNIWSGNDDQVVPLLSLGGKGVVSVAANIIPRQMHDMVALYMAGEIEKSSELQINLYDLLHSLFLEVNPIPVKTAAALIGFKPGELRLPLYQMSDANLEKLKSAMRAAGLNV